jgi:hypothetical protein
MAQGSASFGSALLAYSLAVEKKWKRMTNRQAHHPLPPTTATQNSKYTVARNWFVTGETWRSSPCSSRSTDPTGSVKVGSLIASHHELRLSPGSRQLVDPILSRANAIGAFFPQLLEPQPVTT